MKDFEIEIKNQRLDLFGAQSRSRTGTGLLPSDFKQRG